MPNSTDNDAMPAWLKGDLPPEPAGERPGEPDGGTPAKTGDGESAAGLEAEVEAKAREIEDRQPGPDAAGGPEALGEGVAVLEALAAQRAGAPAREAEDADDGTPAAEGVAEEPAAASSEDRPDQMQETAGAWEAQAAAETVDVSAAEAERAAAVLQAVAADGDFSLAGEPAAPTPEPPPALTLPQVAPLDLEALVEALLFVADGAVTVGQLAEALEVHAREVEAALAGLADSYARRGLSLQRFRDKVQLTTAPAAAAAVERFLGLAAATPLSRAALESLAIIAYQQPVTRPQIEAVRGVNSDSVIKNLLSKGLIEESGRAEGPGRPVLYSTTPEFMQHFGLASLSELPPLALAEAGTPVPSQDSILKG